MGLSRSPRRPVAPVREHQPQQQRARPVRSDEHVEREEDLDTLLHHLTAASRIARRLPRQKQTVEVLDELTAKAQQSLRRLWNKSN